MHSTSPPTAAQVALAATSSLSICRRNAASAAASAGDRPAWCASTASSSVCALPSCRYGAVSQSPRSVGVSRAATGPELGDSVPTSCITPDSESVNSTPL